MTLTLDELDAALVQLEQSRRPRERSAGSNGKKRNGRDAVSFPSELVASLIRDAVEEDGVGHFANRAKVPARTIWSILNTERQISLAVVDELVTRGLGDPGLFHSHPALAAAYER